MAEKIVYVQDNGNQKAKVPAFAPTVYNSEGSADNLTDAVAAAIVAQDAYFAANPDDVENLQITTMSVTVGDPVTIQGEQVTIGGEDVTIQGA